jgi:methylenetetrahydrofolate reductase (NADPH)
MSRTARLSDHYGAGKFGLSFELFPPKSAEGEADLFRNLTELVAFGPSFITCTYGAGGSTRDKTLDIAGRVKQEFGLPVASHLTCVGSSADELREYLREARARGIDYIVALRGDPPKGESAFRAAAGGFSYACELVGMLRSEFPEFDVAVAGYPEKHPEAPDMESDVLHLKHKVDCGAAAVITQLFYGNADFFRFRDRCARAGIAAPIVPGLLPVTGLAQVKRITSMCGAHLPEDFLEALEAREDEPQAQFEVGVEYATRQVEELVREGCPGIHFYVLNKSRATARILRQLALPEAAL